MSRIFGAIRQNGYVVREIGAALEHWTRVLGIGPFFLLENARAAEYRYRGKPSNAAVNIALSYSGGVQIELFQPCDDEPSMARDFLAAGHVGLQHFAYWFDSPAAMDAALATVPALGYEEVQSGRFGDPGRFVHIESAAAPGVCIELSEVAGYKAELFAEVEAAARTWDGVTDPIRRVMPRR